MASGDVFSDTEILLAPLTLLTITPAVGAQVCITHSFAENSSVNFAGGGSAVSYIGDAGGQTNAWNNMCSGVPMKLLITNTETIAALNVHGATSYRLGYTGMEI